MFSKPSSLGLCLLATGGHQTAAMILFRVRYLQAKTKIDGGWIANDREWWAKDLRLSVFQIDRAMQHLHKRGVIEKKQDWFGQRKVLHVRLTKPIADFFKAAAKCENWEMAEEWWDLLVTGI